MIIKLCDGNEFGLYLLYFIIYEYHVVGDLAFELGMDKATCKESCGKFKIKVKVG